MQIGVIEGHTRIIGKSQGYLGLPLRDVAFGFLMRDARPLPFQRCAGRLGFFRPDIDVDIRPDVERAGQGRLL